MKRTKDRARVQREGGRRRGRDGVFSTTYHPGLHDVRNKKKTIGLCQPDWNWTLKTVCPTEMDEESNHANLVKDSTGLEETLKDQVRLNRTRPD